MKHLSAVNALTPASATANVCLTTKMRLGSTYLVIAAISQLIDATPIPILPRSEAKSKSINGAAPSSKPNSQAQSASPSVTDSSVLAPIPSSSAATTDLEILLPITIGGGASVLTLIAIGSFSYWKYRNSQAILAAAREKSIAKFEATANAAELAKATALRNAWDVYDNEVTTAIQKKYTQLDQDFARNFKSSTSPERFDAMRKQLAERLVEDVTEYERKVILRWNEPLSAPPAAGSDEYLLDRAARLYEEYPDIARVDNELFFASVDPASAAARGIQPTSIESNLKAMIAAKTKGDPVAAALDQRTLYMNTKSIEVKAGLVSTDQEAIKAGLPRGFSEDWVDYLHKKQSMFEPKYAELKKTISAADNSRLGMVGASEFIIADDQLKEMRVLEDEAALRMSAGELPVDRFFTDQEGLVYEIPEVRQILVQDIQQRIDAMSQHLGNKNSIGIYDYEGFIQTPEYSSLAASIKQDTSSKISNLVNALPASDSNDAIKKIWKAVLDREKGFMTPALGDTRIVSVQDEFATREQFQQAIEDWQNQFEQTVNRKKIADKGADSTLELDGEGRAIDPEISANQDTKILDPDSNDLTKFVQDENYAPDASIEDSPLWNSGESEALEEEFTQLADTTADLASELIGVAKHS